MTAPADLPQFELQRERQRPLTQPAAVPQPRPGELLASRGEREEPLMPATADASIKVQEFR